MTSLSRIVLQERRARRAKRRNNCRPGSTVNCCCARHLPARQLRKSMRGYRRRAPNRPVHCCRHWRGRRRLPAASDGCCDGLHLGGGDARYEGTPGKTSFGRAGLRAGQPARNRCREARAICAAVRTPQSPCVRSGACACRKGEGRPACNTGNSLYLIWQGQNIVVRVAEENVSGRGVARMAAA